MPDNLNEPTHAGMRLLARDARWADKLKDADGERTSILSSSEYWAVLKQHAPNVDVWRTTYHHPLRGLNGIVEWFKGTGLIPYLRRLSEPEQADFLDDYRELLSKHYPTTRDGTVLLPFPRLFVVARLQAG